MTFGETLKDLMNEHELKPKDIYEKLNILKGTFSKIQNGYTTPSDISLVKKIADIMELNSTEKAELFRSYLSSRIGSLYTYAGYSIEKIFNFSDNKIKTGIEWESVESPREDDVFADKKRIICTAYSLMKKAKDLNIIISVRDETIDICNLIFDYINSDECDKRVKLIFFLDMSADALKENLRNFTYIACIMTSMKTEVHIAYVDSEKYFNNAVFPFYIMSDSEVLAFTPSVKKAVNIHSEKMVRFYAEYFQEKFDNSRVSMEMYDNIEKFFDDTWRILGYENENEDSVYILKIEPGISRILDDSTMYTYMSECDNKYNVLNMYTNFIKKYFGHSFGTHFRDNTIKNKNIIFSSEGFRTALTVKETHEYHKNIDISTSLCLRRKMYKKLIEKMNDFNKTRVFIYDNILNLKSDNFINIWSDGKGIIFFSFKDQYRIFAFKEKNVTKAYINYLKELRNAGVILSQEKSIEIIKRIYDETE